MLLRFLLQTQAAPPDRRPPPTGDEVAPDAPGFLGRIGGWSDEGDEFLSVALWQREEEVPAGTDPACLWHCVQDLGGIYDGLPRALLSANALLVVERRIDEAQQNLLQRLQRELALPALAEHPAFLAGVLAARPDEPGRFLELSLWQGRAEAESFLREAGPRREGALEDAGLPPSPRLSLRAVLRRHTLDAAVPD